MNAHPRAPTPPDAASGAITYAFGEFTLDVESRTLRRDHDTVQLPSRAFDALVYLVEHRDRLVLKNELVDAVWHDVVVTDDSLIHAISVLRRALADDPNHPRYVQTLPRRGYRFVAAVRVIAGASTQTEETRALAVPSPPLGDAAGTARAAEARSRVAPLARPKAVAAGIAAVFAVAIGVAGAGFWLAGALHRETQVHETARAVRLFQPAPEGATIVSGGLLSPDGQYLAFVARNNVSGRNALWVRTLHSPDLRALDKTDGASKPFWSPDSRQIGFFAHGELMAVNASGGEPRAVATVGISPAGGTWAPDDTLLFADWAKGLYAVRATRRRTGGPCHARPRSARHCVLVATVPARWAAFSVSDRESRPRPHRHLRRRPRHAAKQPIVGHGIAGGLCAAAARSAHSARHVDRRRIRRADTATHRSSHRAGTRSVAAIPRGREHSFGGGRADRVSSRHPPAAARVGGQDR